MKRAENKARLTPRKRVRRKPRGKGHERLDEILKAAKQLFLEQDYQTVTTRQLARRAGLSQTGLYLYFTNMEEVHEALCSQTFDQLTQRLRKVAEEASSPEDMLRQAARAYIAFALEHPDEYQIALMQRRPLDPGKVGDLFHPSRSKGPGVRAFLAWREIVQSTIADGFLKPLDLTMATLMTWLPLHGYVASRIALPTFPWPPKHQVVDTLIETTLAGVRAGP